LAPVKKTVKTTGLKAGLEVSAARFRAMGKRVVKPGDCIVITAGVPVGVGGTTNLLKVVEIKNSS
jgi:pyruvate kinase